MTTPVRITYKDDGRAEAVLTATKEDGEKEVLLRLAADVMVECPRLSTEQMAELRADVVQAVDEALGQYATEFAEAFRELYDAVRDATTKPEVSDHA